MQIKVLLIIFTIITYICCQNILVVNLPRANEQIHNKDLATIDYTILGDHTGGLNTDIVYPNSLNVEFVWSEKSNSYNKHQLTVGTELLSDPYPGGLSNIEYKQTWRVPNCHFFSRYNPNQYDFSLVIKPVYVNASVATQPAIVIPLYIDVQNTTFPRC